MEKSISRHQHPSGIEVTIIWQGLYSSYHENDARRANTLFQQPERWLYTWTSPDGQYWNQTDNVLCSQKRRSCISPVQFSHSVVSNSLRSHGLQHARLPCPSPTPRLYSNMSIVSVMPSNHLIPCILLLLLFLIFPSIKVFSKESVLHIRWPKYWSFSFSMSTSS